MWLFENRNFNAHNLPFEILTIAGRVICCGMKDRMAYGCRKNSYKYVAWLEKMVWLMAAYLTPLVK